MAGRAFCDPRNDGGPVTDLSINAWLVLTLSALLIGLAKSGMPGVGIVAVPLFAAVLPARASTGLLLPLLIAGDILAVLRYRRHADVAHLIRLLPSALVGIVIGTFLLSLVTDAQLRPMIGGVILLLLGLHALHLQRAADAPMAPSRWLSLLTGGFAGITTMMANAAGPIMTLYLLAMRLPKHAFIGTAAWFFLIINGSKVPFSAGLGLITLESLRLNACLVPAVFAGSWAGAHLLRRLPQRIFENAARLFAALAAIYLLIP